jgi:protease I
MTQATLAGKKIAILAANGFDENDMSLGQRALLAAGAKITVVSNQTGLINAWNGKGWGLNFPVDKSLSSVLAADFDMLFMPAGERSLNKLLESAHSKRIMRGFIDGQKPIAIKGDAVSLLALADRARDFEVACSEHGPSDILENAGAIARFDAPMIQDGAVLTACDDVSSEDFIDAALDSFTPISDNDALPQAA